MNARRYKTTPQSHITDALNRAREIATPPEATDRATLESYASWLFYERRLLCRQLHPELGADAENYVRQDNPGSLWHFVAFDDPQHAERMNPASRAALVLSTVGVATPQEPSTDQHPLRHDDADLLEAAFALVSAIDAYDALVGENANHPDLEAMVARENESIAALAGFKATTTEELRAKALVVRLTCDDFGGPERSALMRSLADDVLRVFPGLTSEERA